MSWLMVALIGPGTGPRVPINRRKSVLRITGYEGPGFVKAFVDGILHAKQGSNGNTDLPEGEFVQVEYDGPSKCLIAEIARET